MKKMSFLLAAVLTALTGCSPRPEAPDNTLYVSIPPLRFLINTITDDDFDIEVLVPSGASPETFEPTPRQFGRLNTARMIFSVGLIDFEQSLLSRLPDSTKIIRLCRGIAPETGSCAHGGADPDHAHGIDPHIWTSPRELQRMAANAYDALRNAFPDSTRYEENYLILQKRLEALDSTVAAQIAQSGVRSFVIYHPALTYYARSYGLEQIPVENEGKDPSARQLAQLIRRARRDTIRRILYQRQYPASVVMTLARDMHAQPAEIDPLREDVIENIEEITRLITQQP